MIIDFVNAIINSKRLKRKEKAKATKRGAVNARPLSDYGADKAERRAINAESYKKELNTDSVLPRSTDYGSVIDATLVRMLSREIYICNTIAADIVTNWVVALVPFISLSTGSNDSNVPLWYR